MSNITKNASAICVLCGDRPASSGQGDHIPPKSLYPKKERMSAKYRFHTVPACVECNNEGKLADEALKVMISAQTGGRRHNSDDVVEHLVKTFHKNNKIGEKFFSIETPTYFDDGSEFVPKYPVSGNFELAKKALSRIARAMYWSITGEILPKNRKVYLIDDAEHANKIRILANKYNPESFEINGSTFRCVVSDVDGLLIMTMIFFEARQYMVTM